MAGFGYVLIVALAALWSGSEYGSGKQIRTTLLATPRRACQVVCVSGFGRGG